MKKLILAAVAAFLSCALLVGLTGAALAANAIYPKYKEAAMSGGANVNLATCDVRVILLDLADYTYSDAHEFLSDIPSAARVATSAPLTGKTFTDGVFDSNDVTFSAVTGDQAEGFAHYCDTGVEATSRLFLYLDTGQTGLPVLPNGGDITYTVSGTGWATL